MALTRLKNKIHWKIEDLFESENIEMDDLDDWELQRLNLIETSLLELIEWIRDRQKIKESKEKQNLGEIFTIRLEKTDQTSWLFEKFSTDWLGRDQKYDTIMFKNFFAMLKRHPNRDIFRDIVAKTSLYIKKWSNKDENAIKTKLTATKLKLNYCGGVFDANENLISKEDILLSIISKIFIDETYNENGDIFFEKPLEFSARNEDGQKSSYYIVGANFHITE